jgi:hypothetical protein
MKTAGILFQLSDTFQVPLRAGDHGIPSIHFINERANDQADGEGSINSTNA